MPVTDHSTAVAIHNVLFATDFSAASEHAFVYARELTRRFEAVLHIAHAVCPIAALASMEPYPAEIEHRRKICERQMMAFLKSAHLEDIPHEALVREGEIWNVVRQLVSQHHIDLLVMGHHERGMLHKLLSGSVSEEIFRAVHCPVLTVGARAPEEIPECAGTSHILFSTDFSAGSLQAFPYAVYMAQRCDARLTLLHVLPQGSDRGPDGAQATVEDAMRRLDSLAPAAVELRAEPEIIVEFGMPGPDIVRVAGQRGSQLIVMGAHAGQHSASHLPWTVVSYVMANAACPVLTVRS